MPVTLNVFGNAPILLSLGNSENFTDTAGLTSFQTSLVIYYTVLFSLRDMYERCSGLVGFKRTPIMHVASS